MKTNKGFTLIELLVVIGIIAILAAIVIVSINPAKRFQDAQNSQRHANVESILNAVQQHMVDNDGEICGAIPAATSTIASGGAVGTVDMTGCLADYLPVLPVDPDDGSWSGPGSYNTAYTIKKDAGNHVTVAAPGAEGETIEVVR